MNLLSFINSRLDFIEKCPAMFGSPESIELQYLLLLDIKYTYLTGLFAEDTAEKISKDYSVFIHQETKQGSSFPLHIALKSINKESELTNFLSKFRKQQDKIYETKKL